MRVLIIGSEGFIGSHLAKQLKVGELFTADVRNADHGTHQHQLIRNDDFRAVLSDIKPDLCINASGAADVAASFKDPARDRQLNVVNVERMLEAIVHSSPATRFINLSSAAVYGSPETLPISETAPTAPISPYGEHKLEAERLLKRYFEKYDLGSLSLRIFSCYGEGQRKLLLWDMYQKAKANDFKSVDLFGSGEESRDYIHVSDLSCAISIIAASELPFDGGVINVAGGKETTIRTMALAAAKEIHPGLEVRFTGKDHQGYPKRWRADVARLTGLGFSTSTSLEQGLSDYYTWLKRLA